MSRQKNIKKKCTVVINRVVGGMGVARLYYFKGKINKTSNRFIIMKRILAVIVSIVITLSLFSMKTEADNVTLDDYETLRFDLGGAGIEEGYIGVSAEDAYNAEVGYGFANTDAVDNVLASGTGALADAVRFNPDVPNHIFKVDLPSGVYKITVTTGDVVSTTITAEGWQQLFFLTGSNAVDSFTIPVTDGQLNIHAGSGVGTEFSISALEIEQTSTETITKPTIWLGGDSTVASYYNVSDDAKRGWGQYLCNYVDTGKYDIRNISASGITSKELHDYFFGVAEHYGKSGDIILLAVGINDYAQQYSEHADAIDSTEYITYMTEMVKRAKAKGMTVYLVKQHGELYDCIKYPLLSEKWFGDEIDAIAASENVGIIDLYHPWLEFCMENTIRVAEKYYCVEDELHLNALGADMLAEMVNEQLFPAEEPGGSGGEDPYKDFDTPSTVYYETEVSGGPVVNPHKGYVMTVYFPESFEASNPYGIGGSMNNTAWELSTICTGEPKWEELNPAEGVYNWESIDEMLVACEKYGMTYGIRILPYSHLSGSHDNYGEAHDFVPEWVYEKGAKKERATLVSDPSVELDLPKWDDPIFLQACKDFASALAEHYDGDPRVEFIDVSVFGNWGEWHTTTFNGNAMPSIEIQKDMIKYYSDVFDKTWLCLTSGAYGEVYDYSLSLGIPKRVNGLIGSHNYEWNLRPTYKANLPVIGENFLPYKMMLEPDIYAQDIVKDYDEHYLRWTPKRFRETIEISHLSIYAFDQDSHHSYEFYKEQKDLIDEMNNRLGYNFTVTSAKRNENKLLVTIKNTGLAPAFFNIELSAEITDKDGNKLGAFGEPVKIEKGSFRDETEQTFLFEYNGVFDEDAKICLAMYDCDNFLVAGKAPTIKFDNQNTLPNNRLLLEDKKTAHEHAGTMVEQKDATCTDYGVKAYYECSCGKFFTDSACKKEITDLEAWKNGDGRIDKKEHAGGTATCKERAKCSTCQTEYGELATHTYDTNWSMDENNHWHRCTVCENKTDSAAHIDSDKNGKCDICAKEMPHEHTGIMVEPKAATCTTYGVKPYYKCACGKFYSDAICTKEITDLDVWKNGDGRIDKNDHTGGTASCMERAKCLVCGTEYGVLAAHRDSDKDSKCDVCGKEMPHKHTDTKKNTDLDTEKKGNGIISEKGQPGKTASAKEKTEDSISGTKYRESEAHKDSDKDDIDVKDDIRDDEMYNNSDTIEEQTVSMKDELINGKIIIYKTGEDTKNGIAGVEFEIRDKDGNVMEMLVTDKNGYAESGLLPIGMLKTGSYVGTNKYYVVETKAGDGYILDETMHKVDLKYEGNASEVVTYTLSLTNKPIELEISKPEDDFNIWIIGGIVLAAMLAGISIFFWEKRKED